MTLPGQVSSNQSSISSNVITVSKQMAQGVVTGNSPQTILPANVQILNVNSLRPQNSQGGVNKNMSRVMIPQVVGSRPGAPGVNQTIIPQYFFKHYSLNDYLKYNFVYEQIISY